MRLDEPDYFVRIDEPDPFSLLAPEQAEEQKHAVEPELAGEPLLPAAEPEPAAKPEQEGPGVPSPETPTVIEPSSSLESTVLVESSPELGPVSVSLVSLRGPPLLPIFEPLNPPLPPASDSPDME